MNDSIIKSGKTADYSQNESDVDTGGNFIFFSRMLHYEP